MHPHISLVFTSVRLKPWIAINVTDHPACVHLESRCHCLWMKLSTRNCGKTVVYTFEYLISDKACSESFLLHPAASSACWSSPHPISNSQLHVLPHFHLCPIYLVVFKGVYFTKNGISHLEGGFTLRCLQRLSLPDLATRPWLWQANRSTSGPSIPVLSY